MTLAKLLSPTVVHMVEIFMIVTHTKSQKIQNLDLNENLPAIQYDYTSQTTQYELALYSLHK